MKSKSSINSDVLLVKIGVFVYMIKITKPIPEKSWIPNFDCPWSIRTNLLLLGYSF